MGILKGILKILLSMRTALVLLLAQLALFLVGAVQMPTRPEFQSINDSSLFEWLGRAPLAATWWLWASVGVLALLAANTLACSIDSVLKKRMGRSWALIISPQVIHLGFMLLLLAHLMSSLGAQRGTVMLREGMMVKLTGTSVLRVKALDLRMGPEGYPLDWQADVEYPSEKLGLQIDSLGPNKPSYHRGYWIYLKEVRPFRQKVGIFEIVREPGTPWALAGGVLFTLGTVALVALKIRREG